MRRIARVENQREGASMKTQTPFQLCQDCAHFRPNGGACLGKRSDPRRCGWYEEKVTA